MFARPFFASAGSATEQALEDMIRTYLKHWDELDRPIDTRVVAAVRQALERKDPDNGLITTEYHKQFLKRAKST